MKIKNFWYYEIQIPFKKNNSNKYIIGYLLYAVYEDVIEINWTIQKSNKYHTFHYSNKCQYQENLIN